MHTPPGPAADGAAAALVGTVLEDRYRVDAPMARGGMSTVFRGMDLRLDRPVAIKVMAPAYAADPTFLARFEREARAAAKLDNPHVVGVYDQGRDGDNVFLVMELVDGGTLRDVLSERGDLSVRQTLSILEPLLEALSAAHRAGLVHRDVKPENVLISTKGEVKVADFGLVRAVTSTTMATGDVILGTVAYLSPEQVETGASDERSDVYSAGIVAYEMLSGHPPFRGDNAISVAYQHVHSDVPPIDDAAPGVPQTIAEVIDAATARDPLLRPANAEEFLRRLRGARVQMGLSLVPVPTPKSRAEAVAATKKATAIQSPAEQPSGSPGSPGKRAGRRRPAKPPPSPVATRRRRIRLIALAVALVLIAGAVAGGWWLANQWTSMPDVSRTPEAAAVAAVTSAGLVPAVKTRSDDAVPSGQVASADPPADTKQRTGATVQLVISSGRPIIPEVAAGTQRGDAEKAIVGAGFTPVTDADANEYDDSLAVGTVLRTDPPGGERALSGSDVLLVLSRGPRPEPIPPVAGKMAEDAQNKLLVAGFEVGPTQTAFSADVPAGTVLGTDPGEGEAVPRGSTVSLILAVSMTVPEFTPGTVDEVEQHLRAEDFDVRIGEPVFDAEVPEGQVVRIEPTPGTRIDPDDPVVTVIGSNAVAVPPLVGVTAGSARNILTSLGLDIHVRSLFGSDRAIVTDQDPESGVLVEPGSTVTVSAWP